MLMKRLQQLGQSLMQPISVLPVAAILMGIGYALDPSGWGKGDVFSAFLIRSGSAILDNLGLLFAVGIAYGLSKDKNGAAALSGLIGFLVVTSLLSPESVAQFRGVPPEAIPAIDGFAKMNHQNAFIGILSGIIAASTYNKFYQVKLPDALSFFSGRRLTPIMTVFFMFLVSGLLFYIWPITYRGLIFAGRAISDLGAFGAGLYAFLNRLLIPTGLHHALNSVFWWDTIGINDIPNFLSGKAATFPGVTTGMYQAGFFPIMMFGLPGAALAMYMTAHESRKKATASLLLASSLAAFLTGVTEPLEFSFMFLSPLLYLIHAVFTGISIFIAAKMGWIAGFGFSAGLIDFLLSIKNPAASHIWMLVLLGIFFFFLYFFVFRFAIQTFDLHTPGRERIDTAATELPSSSQFSNMASMILEGLGGKENIDTLEHCITRLRVHVKNDAMVNEHQIRNTSISGLIRPSSTSIQVVIGPQVQFVYEEIKKQL